MHRLEITSRMAPRAIFKAFRPIYNDDIYTYDTQNIAVDLEDRTLVSHMTIYIIFHCFRLHGPMHRGHINHPCVVSVVCTHSQSYTIKMRSASFDNFYYRLKLAYDLRKKLVK